MYPIHNLLLVLHISSWLQNGQWGGKLVLFRNTPWHSFGRPEFARSSLGVRTVRAKPARQPGGPCLGRFRFGSSLGPCFVRITPTTRIIMGGVQAALYHQQSGDEANAALAIAAWPWTDWTDRPPLAEHLQSEVTLRAEHFRVEGLIRYLFVPNRRR